jgi:hypothetical protein
LGFFFFLIALLLGRVVCRISLVRLVRCHYRLGSQKHGEHEEQKKTGWSIKLWRAYHSRQIGAYRF